MNKKIELKLASFILLALILLIYNLSFERQGATTSLNTVAILSLCLYLFYSLYSKYGLYSPPVILSFFYLYPLLTPFYSIYLNDTIYFKSFNLGLQEDWGLINKTQLYFFLSFVIIVTVILVHSKTKQSLKTYSRTFIPVGRKFGYFFSTLVVILTYLAEPGGTLLTSNYTQILEGRIQGTQIYAGLFIVFWVLAFLNFQSGYAKRTFIIASIISIVWLLLHAKRAPVVGISLATIIYLYSLNRLRKKHIVLLLLVLTSLIVIGEIRSGGGNGFSLEKDFAALPGNGAGIFLTFMGAIHITDDITEDVLYGQSYLNELIGVIPTPFLKLFNFASPQGYGDLVYSQYLYYQGGMHFLSPAYANFGFLGVVIFSIILGIIISYIHNSIISNSLLRRGHGYILILFFPAAVWYNSMILFSWTIYFFILLFLFNIYQRRGYPYPKNNMH